MRLCIYSHNRFVTYSEQFLIVLCAISNSNEFEDLLRAREIRLLEKFVKSAMQTVIISAGSDFNIDRHTKTTCMFIGNNTIRGNIFAIIDSERYVFPRYRKFNSPTVSIPVCLHNIYLLCDTNRVNAKTSMRESNINNKMHLSV